MNVVGGDAAGSEGWGSLDGVAVGVGAAVAVLVVLSLAAWLERRRERKASED